MQPRPSLPAPSAAEHFAPFGAALGGWLNLWQQLANPLGWLARAPAEQPGTAPRAQQGADLRGYDTDVPTVNIDRLLHAELGRRTHSISPASLALAGFDWAVHLALAPGKWQQLAQQGQHKWQRWAHYAWHSLLAPDHPPCIEPLAQDNRFRSAAWQQWPFNLIWQGFLLEQTWWHLATTSVRGVSEHHERVVSFVARQLLDMASPSNFLLLNPDLLALTLQEGGRNLLRGLQYCYDDWHRAQQGQPPAGVERYRPGREVALTPGKVVYRNRLIELIQYNPATAEVNANPVLIVPAWIMKYYILDLSPHNSLVKYLVDQGHTVFMISWHNPAAADADLTMDDYLRLGVLAALNVIRKIEPGRPVNATGYCLGGTLLAIAAAHLARQGDDILGSLTLLAAQTDFSQAGELMLFIDESQLSFLEDIMWNQGYLDSKQMAGAFQLLRSNDLIWSRMVKEYLMGKRAGINDLMAWNADVTRMPYKMHCEYLRHLFLQNALFQGQYKVDGQAVSLGDIQLPLFVVSTEKDHVSPWHSVYQIKLVVGGEVSFLLTSGGHNAGIVSEPGHPRRHYRVSRSNDGDSYTDPATWYRSLPAQPGSWWPVWQDWLAERAGAKTAPRQPGSAAGFPALADAPGDYVLER